MEFKEVVQARRSCRSFETTDLSEEQLDVILEAGRWAPSPLHLQPWEFITVTDPEIKSRIRGVAKEAIGEVIKKEGPGWVKKYDHGFLEEAPVLLVVVYDPSRAGLGNFFGQEYGAVQAASACVENIMLAAADLGLGSLWFTFFRPERLKKVLNVPDNLEIAGLVPLGKPKGTIKTPPRRDLKVHRQSYGAS